MGPAGRRGNYGKDTDHGPHRRFRRQLRHGRFRRVAGARVRLPRRGRAHLPRPHGFRAAPALARHGERRADHRRIIRQPALREPGLQRLGTPARRGPPCGPAALQRRPRRVRRDLHPQRDGRPAPGRRGLSVHARQQTGDVAGQPQLGERAARVRAGPGSRDGVRAGGRARPADRRAATAGRTVGARQGARPAGAARRRTLARSDRRACEWLTHARTAACACGRRSLAWTRA
jgi:hypothetical protein